MDPLLIITAVVLIVLYAFAWHDQPARNGRQTDEPSLKAQREATVAPQLKTGL